MTTLTINPTIQTHIEVKKRLLSLPVQARIIESRENRVLSLENETGVFNGRDAVDLAINELGMFNSRWHEGFCD